MAKAIMIQGTASNAGKSLIAAGLCRIFAQDGYRVAPFKSQNMALNSFVTKEGLEMGRAQVAQAEAAGLAPDVRMNPILLKPTGESTSQVIINGEVLGNMSAAKYFSYKRELIPRIMKAYDSLAAENDIIVIEGAGSPAEINLKENDIVNMGMAQMAAAPVLLAGDIDRGGVFASLYGTVMLCDKKERSYIKGTIINKFRGDVNILKPGLDMLFDLIQISNLGVIPYTQFDIDDEDSLSADLLQTKAAGVIDIAAIRFPRLSNFTDLKALSHIPGASVRYISSPGQFGAPDLLILPGTKNTLADLKWLKDSGLSDAILRYAKEGGPVFGLCGGYQMLCNSISDPDEVENGGNMEGLSLLPADVVFEREKTRTQAIGVFSGVSGLFEDLNGREFSGYEIHMGKTFCKGDFQHISHLTDQQGRTKEDGLCAGSIYGSYLHGLFDSPQVLSAIAQALYREKGLPCPEKEAFDLAAYRQSRYDLLADTLRAGLDMKAIYKILDKGI